MREQPIATEGPCRGHACDNCARCRSGHCCRRDVPGYRLPDFGDWDGPIHGEWGVLAVENDKVQCHCCGRWYRLVASHAFQIHGLLADEYRAIFGLRARTSLASPELRARKSQVAGPHLKEWAPVSPLKSLTPEQRSRYARGRQWRLEAKLDPANREIWETAAWRQRSAESMRQLVSDPDYRVQFGKKVSEAKGGRGRVACAVCGKEIELKRSLLREGRQRTCSKACFRELRRRAARESTPWRRSDVRHKISERLRGMVSSDYARIVDRLRGLERTAFAALPPRDAEIVRLYHGLTGEQPWTYREIKQRFGLSGGTAHHIVRRSVARLIGLGQDGPSPEPAPRGNPERRGSEDDMALSPAARGLT